MKWLITGGCGFIGISFIKSLSKEHGHSIRVISNSRPERLKALADITDYAEIQPTELYAMEETENFFCELVAGDILDTELAINACKGADIIVHLAASTRVSGSAQYPREDCMTNVIETLNYLESARKNQVKRFLFASSSATTGTVKPPIHEELPTHPISLYGASKLAGEGYCSAYYKTYGIETVALRFANAYGPCPEHKNGVVEKFIKHSLKGKALELYGDGNQTRDFIYIDDLVYAIKRAATVPGIGGEVFQIATGQEITMSEMTAVLMKVLAKAGVEDTTVIYGDSRRSDITRNYADTTKAREIFGWEYTVAIGEGLRRMVQYFIDTMRD